MLTIMFLQQVPIIFLCLKKLPIQKYVSIVMFIFFTTTVCSNFI